MRISDWSSDVCASDLINEMVFAMLFVVAVGLGPFAGVMALFIGTTGVLATLFAEAVEAIDPGPVEGVRATGASALQERSEERRGGKERVRTCRSRWSPCH